jgi:IPT/TIG domain-containing protein
MKRIFKPNRRTFASLFLIVCSVFAQSPIVLAQQNHAAAGRPVDITIGKPSVWTLAQAHYLLANLHEADRQLKIANLADLNPNAVNRNLVEVLKVMFGVSAEFDATAGLRNDLLRQRVVTNYGRQQSLKTELDQRNNEQLQLTRDLALMEIELTKLNAASPKDENAIKIKQAEKSGKETEKSAISNRIGTLNTELASLASEDISQKIPSFGGPFSAAPAATPIAPGLQSLIDKEFLDGVFKSQNSPQLAASMQLDNHIQMQYELIAKQLTLLRDEVGQDERVIFLELPSSIYTVPKRADGHVVQIRWDVKEYVPEDDKQERSASPCKDIGGANSRFKQILEASDLQTIKQDTPQPSGTPKQGQDAAASVRTVDIIPRQSALNVNQIHQTSSGFGLSAKFLAVFGFGAKVDYQRQREIYDQFVYQDIFASGYGKGEKSFGWTFGPLPGTKRIAPGIRTTYAVLVIPRQAKSLTIEGSGYAFDMRSSQPTLGDTSAFRLDSETFHIKIPDDETNGFDITGAQYTSVRSDERVTLTLSGNYFSPQVSMLVNGASLTRNISLQQAPASDATRAGNPAGAATSNGASGVFEYVNSKKIIATFSMPKDAANKEYEGTPTITLVTPQRTEDINRIDMNINNSGWKCDSLQVHSLFEPMFRTPLAITSMEVVERIFERGSRSRVKAILSGTGFRPDAVISINGVPIKFEMVPVPDGRGGSTQELNLRQRSTHQFDLIFPDPGVPEWNVTIRQNTTRGLEEASRKVLRPFAPAITSEILRFTPARGKAAPQLILRLTASGAQAITRIEVVGEEFATIISTDTFATGDVLVTLGLKRDFGTEPILLKVSGDKADASIVSLLPPLPPIVRAIVNDAAQGKSEGSVDGDYSVLIKGERLERVERVYFGTKPAQIQQSSPEVLVVLVPRGEAGSVRVLLETNILYQGRLLSNSADFLEPNKSIFTYVKKAQ